MMWIFIQDNLYSLKKFVKASVSREEKITMLQILLLLKVEL